MFTLFLGEKRKLLKTNILRKNRVAGRRPRAGIIRLIVQACESGLTSSIRLIAHQGIAIWRPCPYRHVLLIGYTIGKFSELSAGLRAREKGLTPWHNQEICLEGPKTPL